MDRLKNKNRCSKCALPVTFPGVKLDGGGVCNYCHYHTLTKARDLSLRNYYRKIFLKEIKKAKVGPSEYDCIVAFSGGKDSAYMTYILSKKYKLKILAHTFDNGFISRDAKKNINLVVKKLKVDHKYTRPKKDYLNEIFNYALSGQISYPKEVLSMLSPVCAVCLGMVFGTTMKIAKRHKIPLLFVGFTPGQYPMISLENFLKVESCMYLASTVYKDDPLDVLKILRDPIEEKFGKKAGKYFFKSQYVRKKSFVPKVLFPFHALFEYDETVIYETINKIGWKKPTDTDSCSTNCVLNAAGNSSCVKLYGYHPYVGEISQMVRECKLSYSDAMDILDINSL